mmetsp:Transcript_32997/g.49184  ORF Transcript_32997/g.49184 Transcript_32997/m.49184 type:complete len:91 (-) Transcript_32997:171-443(-)
MVISMLEKSLAFHGNTNDGKADPKEAAQHIIAVCEIAQNSSDCYPSSERKTEIEKDKRDDDENPDDNHDDGDRYRNNEKDNSHDKKACST